MKKVIIVIVLIVVAAFGWWTISPLFIDKERDDQLSDDIMAVLEGRAPNAADMITPTPTEMTEEEMQTLEELSIENAPDTSEPAMEETSTPTEMPSISVSDPFPIEDTFGHPATGNIRVIRTPDETIVRYEDYDGTNGPDIRVYLATDTDATEFVDLGRVQGNKGNINYVIPDDVDIDEYTHVLTWCRAFGVLFDYAEIK